MDLSEGALHMPVTELACDTPCLLQWFALLTTPTPPNTFYFIAGTSWWGCELVALLSPCHCLPHLLRHDKWETPALWLAQNFSNIKGMPFIWEWCRIWHILTRSHPDHMPQSPCFGISASGVVIASKLYLSYKGRTFFQQCSNIHDVSVGGWASMPAGLSSCWCTWRYAGKSGDRIGPVDQNTISLAFLRYPSMPEWLMYSW